MNDFFEIENELRNLRPAQPSPILFERVEEAMAENCRASVSDAGPMAKWRWRFTEWSRGDTSDMDGQLVRARQRERASQTPYKWGLGLAAAAVLVLFAAIKMERQQSGGKEMAQISREPDTAPVLKRAEESTSSDKFVPAGATRLVYNTRDEGLQFGRGSGQPVRRFRYQTHETWQWRNPTTGASLRVSYPSEEVVLIPVSGQ
jgi:hypothetical protein